jgi:hypothetical protein
MNIFTNHVGTYGLPLGDQLAHAHSRCLPLKGGNTLQGPSNSHNAHFGITYRLGLT